MVLNVGFLTRDWTVPPPFNAEPGGCAYYRCYLPMVVCGHRGRMGLPVFNSAHGFGVIEDGNIGAYGLDLVVLKLIMDRGLPAQIRLAQQNVRQKIIIDIDDFFDGLTPANRAYQITDPETNKAFNRDHYRKAIEIADAVTVSTPFLYDYYSCMRGNVYLIRNGVNMQQFTQRVHRPGKPVIGWAGSIAFRNNDLEQLREWLPDLLEKHDLMFYHLGDTGKHICDIAGIPENRLITSPLCTIRQYAQWLQFDIGIVPLNDIPFNVAKSNIKGLEYAAAGIPFVASDMPEYRLLHETGVGTIASTPEEWTLAVERLLDHRERKKEAHRARTALLQHWTIEHRASEWHDLFNAVGS
jgi:glycosyltransferase involved in cell wall biosynthesis